MIDRNVDGIISIAFIMISHIEEAFTCKEMIFISALIYISYKILPFKIELQLNACGNRD